MKHFSCRNEKGFMVVRAAISDPKAGFVAFFSGTPARSVALDCGPEATPHVFLVVSDSCWKRLRPSLGLAGQSHCGRSDFASHAETVTAPFGHRAGSPSSSVGGACNEVPGAEHRGLRWRAGAEEAARASFAAIGPQSGRRLLRPSCHPSWPKRRCCLVGS